MKHRKSIMIFGGGELQLSIINTAQNLELNTIVLDPDANAIAYNKCDFFYCVSGDDFNKTLEIAQHHNINGIVTAATDKPLLMMARIAHSMALPFPSYESIEKTINKFEFKNVLQEHNLPCAKGILSDGSVSEDDIINNGLDYPLILKPIDNSGSRGVIFCSNYQDVKQFIPDTLNESSSDTVLIEEYLEGDEISVEAVVQNHKVHIIQITDKQTTDFPYNVEIGHIQPSKYKKNLQQDVQQLLQKTVEILGLDDCALHPEMKIINNNLKFIEMGPRLGGDYITSDLVPLSTGVSIEKLLIKISMGEEIEYSINNKSSMIKYFNLSPGDVLDHFPEEIISSKINRVKYKFDLKLGNEIPNITNSLNRYGFVIEKGLV